MPPAGAAATAHTRAPEWTHGPRPGHHGKGCGRPRGSGTAVGATSFAGWPAGRLGRCPRARLAAPRGRSMRLRRHRQRAEPAAGFLRGTQAATAAASARDRMGAGAEADPHVTPQTAAPPPHGRSSVRRITADRGIPGPPSLPWPATDGPPQREARPSPDTARTAARERRPSDPRPPDPRRPVAVHRGRG